MYRKLYSRNIIEYPPPSKYSNPPMHGGLTNIKLQLILR